MLSDGICVRFRRPQHRNGTSRGCLHVDVVDAHAMFGDDLQIGDGIHAVGGHRIGSHHDGCCFLGDLSGYAPIQPGCNTVAVRRKDLQT